MGRGECWEGEGDGQPKQVSSGSIQEGDQTWSVRVRRVSWLGGRGGSSGGEGTVTGVHGRASET